MSRQFATNVTTIYDIFCPVPFLPSPFGFRRLKCRNLDAQQSQTSEDQYWELRNIYHYHPESKKRKSSEANSGSIHPYGRYGNAGKTSKTIPTIATLSLVKVIFEKRAATVEVDTLIFPAIFAQKWVQKCHEPHQKRVQK